MAIRTINGRGAQGTNPTAALFGFTSAVQRNENGTVTARIHTLEGTISADTARELGAAFTEAGGGAVAAAAPVAAASGINLDGATVLLAADGTISLIGKGGTVLKVFKPVTNQWA